ncbi:hypothetical protein TURU_077977 [Turdus rufiventris]|nr:hypothetical protein TURU_077977 [Turdus rufiventris]
MGPVLFNICVSSMNSGIKFNLSKFDKDTKLRGAVNILDGIDAIQMDLDRLERHIKEAVKCRRERLQQWQIEALLVKLNLVEDGMC